MSKKRPRRPRKAQQKKAQYTRPAQEQLPQVPEPEPIVWPLVVPTSRVSAALFRTREIWDRTWKILVFVVAPLIFVAAVMADMSALSPQLSAQALSIIDPSNPASALITIKNESVWAIYEVNSGCVQNVGVMKGVKREGLILFRGNVFILGGRRIEKIVGGDVTTISCADMIRHFTRGLSITTIDFMVHLTFRPWFLPTFVPYRFERNFRFVAIQDQEGKFTVFPQTQIPIPDVGR